ncbi:MAG: hypothetical protein LQ342_000847 [Letrouitia transgressa]|nr:MAG: hypothetical protein LQ342_000847 [Letrouitia transgressa]
MIIGQAIFQVSRYKGCNSNLLRACTAGANLALLPATRLSTTKSQHRKFTKEAKTRYETAREPDIEKPLNNFVFNEESAPDPSNETKSNTLPWYLQVEVPRRELGHVLDRQQLPELPPNPPPLLQPILEHISINLGLDDLTLLDLRHLDPPPALGANLLMILGTARSEKHLHVSADRFCRWLRTEHKLSPYPDGLLGRGELKLKMKRKARRARLLSKVGSSESSNSDDGIRNGWVCVNIGVIEDGRVQEVDMEEDTRQDFVGFNDAVHGASVVVQMLTGERREELDLESLWKTVLAQQALKAEKILTEDDHAFKQEQGGSSAESSNVVENPT